MAGAQEGTTDTASTSTAPASTTDTGTTAATTTAPTQTQPTKPKPRPRPKPRKPAVSSTIAPGITIGRILVGGLTPKEAAEVVRTRFQKPLTIVVSPTRRIRVAPAELGAASYLGGAVKRARAYRMPLNVPLKVDVSRARVERFVAALARELDRDPVDARLRLRNFRPVATKAVEGRRLKQVATARAILTQLKTHRREPIELSFVVMRPAVTAESLGDVIVIRRESKTLQLFDGTKLRRTFRVATGQSSYPTPIGQFEIINKWANPWWYPPQGSSWAQGKEPIPPGPGNPLGTRWMGISSPYVGIHGTPDASSIGYSASHGCIRMLIPQVEWLFEQVEVGTPVFIVGA
jgi:lipoprotein-anchoring transpeptidase ErfK/SrfK